ncbi:MAG: sugar phosphate isomerase/epimerase family protein [Verrucomicrobiota bacterium]|nr:sugar phosphate isomerase/epimerase [Verrucomicrobiota bacterium]
MHTLSRRHFLKLTGGAGLGLFAAAPSAIAAEPIKRTGKPRLQLSLAAYSFRQYFRASSHPRETETDPARRIDLFDFIDYCADHGCAGAELTAYYFPNDVTPEYFIRIKRHAFLRGVAVSGTSVGNNFALPKGEELNQQIAAVKRWIEYAAVMGAPHIRVFAGAAKGISDAEARKMCIGALEECCAYAGTKGIFLGLENHGGIVAEPEGLLEIVRAVNSPWIGINLDTGNFHTDDPYADLEKIAPYAVNVQFKVEVKRKGQPAGEPADLPRVVAMLRAANYQGFVALEYEAKPDPWSAIPPVLRQMKELFAA